MRSPEQFQAGYRGAFADRVSNRDQPLSAREVIGLVGEGQAMPIEAERRDLLAWPDSPDELERLHSWLLARSAELPQGPARAIDPLHNAAWLRGGAIPDVLLESCRQLGVNLRAERWSQLDELERFALVKLCHPGHEHRNLPRALEEFDLKS